MPYKVLEFLMDINPSPPPRRIEKRVFLLHLRVFFTAQRNPWSPPLSFFTFASLDLCAAGLHTDIFLSGNLTRLHFGYPRSGNPQINFDFVFPHIIDFRAIFSFSFISFLFFLNNTKPDCISSPSADFTIREYLS